MRNIINFRAYVEAQNEERKRIKKLSVLSSQKESMLNLLQAIDDCLGASLLTKQINEHNQIVGKENPIEGRLLDVLISSVEQCVDDVDCEILELENANYVIN